MNFQMEYALPAEPKVLTFPPRPPNTGRTIEPPIHLKCPYPRGSMTRLSLHLCVFWRIPSLPCNGSGWPSLERLPGWPIGWLF